VLLSGLTVLSALGIFVDLWIAPIVLPGGSWLCAPLLIATHFAYSVVSLLLVLPVLRRQVTVVIRNELTVERSRSEFYVARQSSLGPNTPANNLDDEEFNCMFDQLEYNKESNAFDRGCVRNCFRFWCAPRTAEQLGDF